MYPFYRFFGKLSKLLSNIMLAVIIPVSIIICAAGWCLFFIRDVIKLFGADPSQVITSDLEPVFNILKWVGLGIALFVIVCYLVFFLAWIFNKITYKKIADNYITRNKEFRNRDINKTIEKLENYRYRD